MKRLMFLIALIMVAMISMAQRVDKSIKATNLMSVSTNYTLTNTTVRNFIVYAPRAYPTIQSLTINYDTLVSGLTNVATSLWGKLTVDGDSTQIGSTNNWNCTSDPTETITITNTTANLYQYYTISIVGTGTGQVTIDQIDFQLWNATYPNAVARLTGTGGITITGGTANLNASSNFATNIGTGTTNAAVSIGGGSNTVAINSSDWDITTAGVITGVGNITSDGNIAAITYNFGTAAQVTGTGDSIVFTNPAIGTIAAGMELTWVSEAANTTTVRLDVNGVVKDVYEETGAAPNAMEANDIRSGAVVRVVYDGTRWVQISPSGN